MASPNSKSPFVAFNQLAISTWYLDPTDSKTNGTTKSTPQPGLIILSTWMGASPRHILKYTNTYRRLYPASPLLVLTNNMRDIIVKTSKEHKRNLSAAISVIRGAQQSDSGGNILLHIFSNGGAHHAAQLAKFYRLQYGTPLPVTGIALDSAPGRATYGRSIAAMSVGLPRFFLFRFVGLLMLHVICIGMWIKHHILKRENVITRVRRELNDSSLFPVSAKKVYLYSPSDAMVGWEDVERNAKEAEEVGYSVYMAKFDESKHVGHVMEDPERYWGAVGTLLEKQ
jgi:hypothetical protein